MSPAHRIAQIPPGLPRSLSALEIRERPLEFLTTLTTYGDLTRHETHGEVVYVLNRPDLAQHVLKDNWTNYAKAGTPDDLMLSPLLGDGLLTSEGKLWTRQRRICAPAFRANEVMRFDRVVAEAAVALVADWRLAIQERRPLQLDRALTSATLTVVARAMFASDIGGIGDRFGQAVDAVNQFLGHYLPDRTDDPETTRLQQDFIQARFLLHQIVNTLIASRRALGNTAAGDLLGKLLSARDEDTGEALCDVELRDLALTIIMAGHETTAKALGWTFYLIDRHRDVGEQVRAEIDSVLGNRLPTADDLPQLPYCHMVLKESMRLYPPVWLISRRVVADDNVGGYVLGAGSLVCISPYTLHRHPGYWDCPEKVIPERFAPHLVPHRPSHLYLPFGGGPRTCIGRYFAMTEAILMLATLCQHVRLELIPGHPVEPEALVTLRPKHGLLMTAIPRHQQGQAAAGGQG